MRHYDDDAGGRCRRNRALADDREVDWMGVEKRINCNGVKSEHVKKFATENELLVWIAGKRTHRFHRGAQRRLLPLTQ